SKFKNDLLGKLVDNLSFHSVQKIYISVIDVTSLAEVKEEDWNAIIIINTIEWYKLQKDAEAFINSAKSPEKIIVLATSGDGNMKPKTSRIDTITSASKIDTVDQKVEEILEKLSQIL
ncbi:hypothetical protein ACFL4O_02210, partial [bacterium]